jgi:hypothetical protein
MASVVAPPPLPTSMTRSPGAMRARAWSSSAIGAKIASGASPRSVQGRPPGPFQ